MQKKDLFKYISIVNVKNKLNLEEVCSFGDTIYVKCPFCYSKNGDMKLNVSNNSYICKHCEEKGYAIGLYAKLKYMSNKEAFKELILQEPESDFKYTPIINNNRKSDEELDNVYRKLLSNLKLEDKHYKELLSYGFTNDDIKSIGFKTIPLNENRKIEICNKIIKDGYELQGTPGFYQNANFKWTFKSHSGIFVPVISNNTIIGLRINLDKKYSGNTTDIWFSSKNEYNGCKARNEFMMLRPETFNIQLLNKNNRHDVIIATEMILAHKLHSIYKNEIVIGIPNIISKSETEKLANLVNIDNIYLVMDFHTITNSAVSAIENLYNYYGKDKIINSLSFRPGEIPETIKERFDIKELKQNIA